MRLNLSKLYFTIVEKCFVYNCIKIKEIRERMQRFMVSVTLQSVSAVKHVQKDLEISNSLLSTSLLNQPRCKDINLSRYFILRGSTK